MIEPVWKTMEQAISGEQAREYAVRINAHARWFEFEELAKTCEAAAEMMRDAGLEQVELIETPADGRTAFGGWVNPEFWHVTDAVLRIVEPGAADPVLAHYRANPCSLMQYSKPTPPGGVLAQVLAIEGSGEAAFAGRDIAGKVVLLRDVRIQDTMLAFSRGAVGVICDALGTDRFVRPAETMATVTAWRNYAIPPWQTELKGFGFSVSPAQGRRLRDLLTASTPVVVHAEVKGELRTGPLYLVTGVLPGTEPEEIGISGHIDEFGADDNASGCGLGIEIARAIGGLVRKGTIARPRRGLRLIYGMEIRGTNAFLALSPSAGRLRGGVNLDMVGVEQNAGRVICALDSPPPTEPVFHHYLAERLLERLRTDYPYLRFVRTRRPFHDDNAMGEPMFRAGWPVVCQAPAPHHHTSLDTAELLSPVMLKLMGTCFGSYALLLMNAGPTEALWLAQLAYDRVRRDLLCQCEQLVTGPAPDEGAGMASLEEQFSFLARYGAAAIASVTRLVETDAEGARRVAALTAELARRFQTFAAQQAADVATRITQAGRPMPAATSPPSHALAAEARGIIPRKAFPGYLGWEWIYLVSPQEREAFLKETGTSPGWCAPDWIQFALFWSNGQRDLVDIHDLLRASGNGIGLDRLVACIRHLSRQGFVTLR